MYINKNILRFRLLQIWKTVREIPIPYIVALVLILLAVSYAVYGVLKTQNGALGVAGFTLLLLYMMHSKRKDYRFILLIDEHPWRVFCADYLLISSPVLILLFARGYWAVNIGLFFCCLAISFLKQSLGRGRGVWVPRFIPYGLFEFRSGMRRYGVVFLLLNLVALVLVPFVPYVSFVLVWFALLQSFDFFDTGESKALLCSKELPAGRFLKDKIAPYLLLYALLTAPICFFYPFMYEGGWLLSVCFFVATQLNVVLVIFAKYAFYRPGATAKLKMSSFFSVAAILIPIFLPITCILLIRYYLKAYRNLTSYLYAYN